ncbi:MULTISPECIES: hypothetical protein [unclassified Thioalkalivibrio]|uniref:hypothetical protein n=1 Tax=unclassified Thioalkalivibrio TaxID=2621013 RepID=UPI0003999AF7|nr:MULTISPECIES: hypothetical protein [unclassified Thioalkalivibrio]
MPARMFGLIVRLGPLAGLSLLGLTALLPAQALSAVTPAPLPHNTGFYLSPYTASGELAGWVDEALGESSRDISGLAGRLLQTAAMAYGAQQSNRLGGMLDQASRSSGIPAMDFGQALAAATEPGRTSAGGLEQATAILGELGSRGLVGEHAGHQVRRLAQVLEDPETAVRGELERLQIGSRDIAGVLRELERLPQGQRQGVLGALDQDTAPALELLLDAGHQRLDRQMRELTQPRGTSASSAASVFGLLARDHDAGLFGAGELLQRQLGDHALRQGAELGMGFFALFDGLSQTHRQLELTPERMVRYRQSADRSFNDLDSLLVHTMVHYRTRRDFARASEALMLLYPEARPRMDAAHAAAGEIITAELHRMQQRMDLQWQ